MGNKMVHFLVSRLQRTKNGADYGFNTVPIMVTRNRHTKLEPFMAPLMENLLSQPAGVNGPLHDKAFESPMCPAEDVTNVGD